MELKCFVNVDKRRVHIVSDDGSIDELARYSGDTTFQEKIVSMGYKVEDLKMHIFGEDIAMQHEPKYEVTDMNEFLPKDSRTIVTHAGAHEYIETYMNHLKELDSKLTFKTNPVIIENYAICAENYPEGIDIFVTAPAELESKVAEIIDSLRTDLEILTDNVAEIRLTLERC